MKGLRKITKFLLEAKRRADPHHSHPLHVYTETQSEPPAVHLPFPGFTLNMATQRGCREWLGVPCVHLRCGLH